eukprot:1558423-Karenia_brevis.AAC.1
MHGIFAHVQCLAITASNQSAITVGPQTGKYMFMNLFRASADTEATVPVYSYSDFLGTAIMVVAKSKLKTVGIPWALVLGTKAVPLELWLDLSVNLAFSVR